LNERCSSSISLRRILIGWILLRDGLKGWWLGCGSWRDRSRRLHRRRGHPRWRRRLYGRRRLLGRRFLLLHHHHEDDDDHGADTTHGDQHDRELLIIFVRGWSVLLRHGDRYRVRILGALVVRDSKRDLVGPGLVEEFIIYRFGVICYRRSFDVPGVGVYPAVLVLGAGAVEDDDTSELDGLVAAGVGRGRTVRRRTRYQEEVTSKSNSPYSNV